MKSNNLTRVHMVRFLAALLVVCPGQNVALALGTQAKAQLHIPWKLLSERLRTVANLHGADGSYARNAIESRLISVPYNGETLIWNLTSGSVLATSRVDQAEITSSAAVISIKSAEIQIVLDQLTVDQVIEREIGGVKVRVHLNATCGPIAIKQAAAQARALFEIDWSKGSPVVTLNKLDLGWAPNSWTFNDFVCTGPSGVDTLVHDGIASYLRDPADFKLYVEKYISDNLKKEVDAVLAKVRTPFTAGKGAEAITISVGAIAPVSTGVIGDLTLTTNGKSSALPAAPLPSASVLSSLSNSEPSLIGDLQVLEFIVATKLRAQKSSYRFNLQTVPAFHKLMHSRISQLFVWGDLLHFEEDAPFYLTVQNPRHLDLARGAGSTLTSNIPVTSVIQAYRDGQWWSWVDTKGRSAVSVAIGVRSGRLSYATSVDSLEIKSQYGAAYRARYHKKSEKLPDNIVAQALTGSRPEISGSMKFPDVDLDAAGTYRASSFEWVNKHTFSLNFSSVN